MNEIWKDIEGFEGYEVSNKGNVRSWRCPSAFGNRRARPKMLSKVSNQKGYLRVFLVKNKKRKTKYIHRLVCKAFNGVQNDKEVNHKDLNKENNYASNLEWCTHAKNQKHALDNGAFRSITGENQHRSKFKESQIKEIRKLYASGNESYNSLAEKFDTSFGNIGQIVKRQTWKHI